MYWRFGQTDFSVKLNSAVIQAEQKIDKAGRMKIVIKESKGVDRFDEPLTIGVPFQRGSLINQDKLYLTDNGNNTVRFQSEILANWPDRSIKWLLLDFFADCRAGSSSCYFLNTATLSSGQVPDGDIVSIKEDNACLSIDTGEALFVMDKKTFRPFNSVKIAGHEIIDASSVKTLLMDERDDEYLPVIEKIDVETEGRVRNTVCVDGHFISEKGRKLSWFCARVNFYGGSSTVKIDFTIRNPKAASHPGGLWDLGDDGSMYFNDLSFQFGLAEKSDCSIFWKTGAEREMNALNGNNLLIYQDSSGGENWDSPNHVNREGEVRNSFRGYRVIADNLLEEGYRASPVLSVASGGGKISASIQKFWQNSPKSVEVGNNLITLGLFPKQYNDIFELQGGEQKTHTVYINFNAENDESMNLDWIHEPLIPRLSSEWYSQCGVPGYISPEKKDRNPGYRTLVSNVIEGDNNFFNLREKIDEYGWRNFGEVFASHEYAGYEGSSPLFVSHYNNQYDIVMGCLLQYARSGEPRWYELMDDLVKHVIDIDIYHTQEDRPGFNGGQFWHTDHFVHARTSTHRSYSKSNVPIAGTNSYGGGLSPENCYSTGLCNYYYMTGNRMAKEAVIELRKETGLCALKLHWRLKKQGLVVPRSTIAKILKDEGLVRKYRVKKIKYKYLRAKRKLGELLEMDVKYVPGAIQGLKYYQYTVIDTASRWRHLEVFDEQSTHHSIRMMEIVMKRFPHTIQAVKTDNHSTFTNYYVGTNKRSDVSVKTTHALDVWCGENNIVHYLIDPGKPAQNGTVERSHREDEEKFYQKNTFKTKRSLKKKIRVWNEYYNDLEHCGLDGKTPNEVLYF